MANINLFASIVSSLLLLALSFPIASSNKDERVDHIVVEGMVYCQSCQHFGTMSFTGAEPIPSAKISVTCKDRKNNVKYYKVFETDRGGHFYAELDGFKESRYLLEHPLHSCSVKLVWSPLESCNVLSNVNYALDGAGAPLRYETKRWDGRDYEAVIYGAGPLAFRPSHCTSTYF